MKLLSLIIFFSFNTWAQTLELSNFVHELSARQSKVEEFVQIRKIATELGIKHVYMFGGTAAAWGHYVRWDMRRELGIENLQPGRFDYDYTNIFRANQDFDVVIDGTVKQAEALEAAVQKQFNYFSGTRPTWEVRLLNEKRLDKDPIMGADFQNQHTDSHSTGLIEMMDCEGFDCVKDVRDFHNPESAFLMDLFEAKLHYYFSTKHKETKRFKNRMNPEILSVVRYYTKVVQYGLEQRSEDINRLNQIISKFDPSQKSLWNSYVLRWLEKNGKKLIVNAIDMEFAQNLIESNGLKEKLISLGNPNQEDSMAWWLNKESLKSFPLGRGDGKTAAEIFNTDNNTDIIVAHETNSFPAFESITKAHNGIANVLISREGVRGEAALYGNGHYTKVGRVGAAGTGLTIRYKLNPLARTGSDFIKEGEYVIIQNRNALEVIHESFDYSVIDYFKMIASGFEFDHNDRGVVEKLRRKLMRKSQKLSLRDIKKIEKIVLKKPNNQKLRREWHDLIVNRVLAHELESFVNHKLTESQKKYQYLRSMIDRVKLVLHEVKFRSFTSLVTLGTLYHGYHLLWDPYIETWWYRLPIGAMNTFAFIFGTALWFEYSDFRDEQRMEFSVKSFVKLSDNIFKRFNKFMIKKKIGTIDPVVSYELPGMESIHLGSRQQSHDQVKFFFTLNPNKTFSIQKYKSDFQKLKKLIDKAIFCDQQYL